MFYYYKMSETLDLTTVSTEEPVVSEVIEDADQSAEESVEEPADEPVVDEPVVEEPVVEEATEVESPEPVAVEQVASDIRGILSDVTTVTTVDNLCSLKTLIDVMTKWTENKIHRSKVEKLLRDGTETDENLNDLEKFIEIFKIWITIGGGKFKANNLFSKIDDYSLTTTVNITGEKISGA